MDYTTEEKYIYCTYINTYINISCIYVNKSINTKAQVHFFRRMLNRIKRSLSCF